MANDAMTNDPKGGLAQLARALALQARGHRFESDILHKTIGNLQLAIDQLRVLELNLV